MLHSNKDEQTKELHTDIDKSHKHNVDQKRSNDKE